MAGYKETPRQKMIGMMYLVLTALLALNVSKDILDAFVVVNDSLIVTNENFEKKINLQYSNFEKQKMISPEKVGPYYDKAMQAKKYADELVLYIAGLRDEITAKSDKLTIEEAKKITLKDVAKKDDYDTPTNYFIGDSQDGSKGKARELKEKIEKFKKDVTNLVDAKYQKDLRLGLNTADTENKIEGKVNWEMKNFYHLILAGVVTNLNKMITEVRNAEFDVVNTLYSSISADDFKFDNISAKVLPKSNYVLVGSEYEADIFVAAYDSKQTPEVLVGADVDTVNMNVIGAATTIEGVGGVVKYKLNAAGVGEKKYGGIIKIKKADGSEKKYWFRSEYVVGAPTATVSADKMNVFYIGVANPVSISVPGVPSDKVRPSITAGGTLTAKGGGKYEVWVTQGTTKVTINVAAEISGKSTAMGKAEFRVKRVPDPVPYIANNKGGLIAKNTLASAPGIIPVMENFDFDLNFVITSFTMTMNVKGDLIEKNTTGNKLTADMAKMIQSAGKGTKVYLENIKAKGPDGTTRSLASINLKLQ